MTCQQVQSNLSFYLYGELDFAAEEGVEEHLAGCAFCQLAVQREKSWHASLQSESESVPLQLLAECRQHLSKQVAQESEASSAAPKVRRASFSFTDLLDRLAPTGPASVFGSWVRSPWPARMATASFLLISGFYLGRWGQHDGQPYLPVRFAPPAQAGLLQPYARVREIQPDASGQIRLSVERGEMGQLTGAPNSSEIRQYLLIAARDASDPAIRFDSVETLSGQTSTEVRDALVARVQRDPNAAVRVKALEGLRPFAEDGTVRKTLVFALQHDENPGVRSAAIDLLAPTQPSVEVTPEVIAILRQVLSANPGDEYVRQRSLQVLQSARPTQEATTY